MDDSQIIDLYFNRDENAIIETDNKYGKYCFSIANNILGDKNDAEESVNDTYLNAWNSIPPHKPSILSTFLGKITRRLSIDKWRKRNAEKRGGGETPLVLDELKECVADTRDVESEADRKFLCKTINTFIDSLSETEQKIFICRYWYLDSIETISRQFGFSESKVKSILFRTRKKLKETLIEEGFYEA